MPDCLRSAWFTETLAVKATLDKTVARLQERALDFEFKYRNSGYMILAKVVERLV